MLQALYNSSSNSLLPVPSMVSAALESTFSGKKLEYSAFPHHTVTLHPDTVIPALPADWSGDIRGKAQMFPGGLQDQPLTAASAGAALFTVKTAY